jgi:hypothetical protein
MILMNYGRSSRCTAARGNEQESLSLPASLDRFLFPGIVLWGIQDHSISLSFGNRPRLSPMRKPQRSS